MVEEIARALEKLAAQLRAGEATPDDLVGWMGTLGQGLELESTPERAKERARSLWGLR